MNLLGRCFQEDFFELDTAALPNDIFIWQAASRDGNGYPMGMIL